MQQADSHTNTAQSQRDQLEKALDKFRPGFQADGMELTLGELTPAGTAQVKVVMGPNACEECLMPQEMLSNLLLAGMRSAIGEITRVEIVIEHPSKR